MLSMKELEAQSAVELPDRDLMAIIILVRDVIDVGDILVPVGVAANLCDVNAAVLVADFRDDGSATCTATATSQASPGPGNNPNS